jgi:uncharacterized membrane protein (UPF0136 family)
MTTPSPTNSLPPQSVAPTKTLSLLSFIAGVAGFLMAHTVVVPVAAIVLGFLARAKEPTPHPFATWGIVLGFVALFGWIVVALLAASFALPYFIGAAAGIY